MLPSFSVASPDLAQTNPAAAPMANKHVAEQAEAANKGRLQRNSADGTDSEDKLDDFDTDIGLRNVVGDNVGPPTAAADLGQYMRLPSMPFQAFRQRGRGRRGGGGLRDSTTATGKQIALQSAGLL